MSRISRFVWMIAVLALAVGSAGIASAAPVPKELKNVPAVVGTTWEGTNSLGNPFTFTFEKDGTLVYTTPGRTIRNNKWKQTGNAIYLEINDKYAEYYGEIDGDTIEGKGSNVKGITWTWKITRVKPEKEK